MGPESIGLSERCLVGFNAGPPLSPSAYNNNLRIVQTPDAKARFDQLGTRLNPMTPEKFTEFLQAEIAKYTEVIRKTGVRME